MGGKNTRLGVLLLLLICVSAVYFYMRPQEPSNAPDPNAPPRTLINNSVDETVADAAKKGWVPCPGKCLKLADPGWHHQDLQGFPATYIWMTYPYSDGEMYYSQNHIGHIIESYPDRPAKDIGICPICNGSGWVAKKSKSASAAAGTPQQP